MRKFSELKKLTAKQEGFVDEWMYKWGAWKRKKQAHSGGA